MKRKIYDKLCEWKSKSKGESALLIEGARRVGKSYIVEAFAKAEYKSYLLIDFTNTGNDIRDLFINNLHDLDTFFVLLQSYYNIKLYKRESLLIFDEVQMFPRARAAIKYLVADGRYDYIETGSLVSIKKNVNDIVLPSEELRIKMHPMDFEEFLWALGNDLLYPLIMQRFMENKPLGQALHRKAMDFFRQYMIIGGMPQAVKQYADNRDLNRVDTIKRNILSLYRDDISKHAERNAIKATNIFDEIPSQLQRHDRKFKLSSLKKEARFRDYDDALFWLTDAMIINTCYNCTEPVYGLKLKADRLTLKCYMADTGLLISHAFDEKGIIEEEVYRKLLVGAISVNMGMIVENIVAQMLVASGHKLYFYSNPSRDNSEARMEIDFLTAKTNITNKHNISPIEVKSGKNYTLSSIRKFRALFREQLHTPYVIHTKDIKEEDGIVFIPLYMAMML